MTIALALFCVAGAMALLAAFGVPARAAAAIAAARQALAVVRSRELEPLAKERAVQAHARGMLFAFVVLVCRTALAFALPLAAVWLAHLAGLADFAAVLDATLSWPILLATVVAGVLVFATARR